MIGVVLRRSRVAWRGVAVATAIGLVGCGGDAGEAPYEVLDRLRVLGLAHLEEEQPAEAVARFEELARLAPREPLGPANLAVAELRRGQLDAALAAAMRAVERDSTDADVRVIAAGTAAEAGEPEQATTHLRAALARDPDHVPALWALHELTGESEALDRLLRRSAGNLPARLVAAESRLEAGELDGALAHLERIEQLLAPGPSEAREELMRARTATSAGATDEALRHVRILHNLARVDQLYTRGLSELTGRPGSRAEPLHRFRHVRAPARPAAADPFDATFVRLGGLERGWTAGVVTDLDGDGDEDLVVSAGAGVRCLRSEGGRLVELDCAPDAGPDRHPVQAADFDGDGRADLLMAGPGGVEILYAADEWGYSARAPLPGHDAPAHTAIAADLDHDGDLDILVGGPGPTRLLTQTSVGQFEPAEAASLVAVRGVRAVSFGDLDLDGDLDLVLATRDGIHRLDNVRHGSFVAAGGSITPTGTPSIADVNGDGWLDLLVVGGSGVLVAAGDGEGGLDPLRPATGGNGPVAGPVAGEPAFPRLMVEDLDLDGRLDLVVSPEAGELRVFRGSGESRFVESPSALAPDASGNRAAGHVLGLDLDGDRDFDLAIGDPTNPALYRNREGERNHTLEIRLLALADGSGKVNRLGIGSRIDVWAGGVRQTRVVRGELERFGLGDRDRADVVRIEWTNGVPQNVFEPNTSERLVERQVLKGSCAFLYAWSGDGFEFVTDMMWKSALGMPLGIMAGELEYAPPDPSLEYVRIPPELLTERDGHYELRITEELWEVAYLDRLELVVVDHPAGVELYVDEAFGAPTVPNERLYPVRDARAPERAIDHRGLDVGPELAARDFSHVGGFERGAYQGLTGEHDLTLTLAGAAGRPARLFLGGWIHPTDASINVRMGQAGAPGIVRPYLEVPDGAGGWQSLGASIDFPSGKNKTVVVDLPDGLPADDPRLRIRTNMEIYWDVAFYTPALELPAVRRHRVAPVSAELHARGFSRMSRRGGRYGPHWYDYEWVDPSPWRPLAGGYTRFGAVRELLLATDDRYVVFGPGDEIAVRFEAPAPPPEAWTRTVFLYSDGFLKDADLNTRGGQRVGPLPWRGQEAYPGTGARVDERRAFADAFLTRRVEAAPAAEPRR